MNTKSREWVRMRGRMPKAPAYTLPPWPRHIIKKEPKIMQEDHIVRTVGELISVLSELDPSATVISHEAPFTGVKVVAQDNGGIYLASLWDTDEGHQYRALKRA